MDKLPDPAQNVVAMTSYQPDTGYSAIAQIEAYWEALRGTRLLPKRSDIDPRGIEQALEYAFILERIAPGIARLRIAGTHLNELMGMEVRGMPLTAFFTPEARAEVSDALEHVFQTPAVCTLHIASGEAAGRPPLEGRLILLPLKSDLGDVSRVLGCLVTKGDMGLAPRRFEVARKDVLNIAADRTLTPAKPEQKRKARSPAPKQPVSGGFADEAKAFVSKDGKQRPPYLRLIKSDD